MIVRLSSYGLCLYAAGTVRFRCTKVTDTSQEHQQTLAHKEVRREGRARFVPNAKGRKGMTSRQTHSTDECAILDNSKILHHRDVQRAICDNIFRVIIVISTQNCPFACSLRRTTASLLPCFSTRKSLHGRVSTILLCRLTIEGPGHNNDNGWLLGDRPIETGCCQRRRDMFRYVCPLRGRILQRLNT